MSSNGLLNYAKRGKCRICQRVRKTDLQVKPVGEVRRGYATGHIWECIDTDECDNLAKERMNDESRKDRDIIKIEFGHGRFEGWVVRV